ncbi:hypothetical protein [Neisseria sp. Ec49-e6-T10]|uniref:hypothetical protein n=1 Tax=Neisseria sp. Ec49-e6-T10 TaxID=3140744 RepID=UPI003EC0E624
MTILEANFNMGIKSSAQLATRDIYIDYDLEEVMFRWDFSKKQAYRKFYNEQEESLVPINNKLYNEVLLFGDEISKEQYEQGK